MEANKPALLIVDDEQDTCANLCDIFSELGYHVDTATDGPAALALVERRAYEVALLDLKMPGMNGLELYRELRRRSAATVAIIVTAFGGSEIAKCALAAGAWRVVPKPVDLPALLSVVEEAASQPLVMVVDDDDELCQSMWDLLRQQGFRVALAHGRDSSKALLRRQVHQVVMIDMKLPDADGTQVLKMVHELNPAARTLIITGCAAELHEPLAQALASGADTVCYKPFNIPELLATIRRLSATNMA